MRKVMLGLALLFAGINATFAQPVKTGIASWYGEEHRGKLMANGKKFDPDKLTAASWFYPLGTVVRVTLKSSRSERSVVVTITDRGPAMELVREGRIIDLGRAAFKHLGHPDTGLVEVIVKPVSRPERPKMLLAAK